MSFWIGRVPMLGALVAAALAMIQFATLDRPDSLQMFALYAFALAIPSGMLSLSLWKSHHPQYIYARSALGRIACLSEWLCLGATIIGFGTLLWRFSNTLGIVFVAGTVAAWLAPGAFYWFPMGRFDNDKAWWLTKIAISRRPPAPLGGSRPHPRR